MAKSNNIMLLTLEHRAIDTMIEASFSVRLDGWSVKFQKEAPFLYIEIAGQKEMASAEQLSDDLMGLLFILLGGCPQITSISVNGQAYDTSSLANRYFTDKSWFDVNLILCKVSPQSINDRILEKYRSLNQYCIHSLQYLLCEKYKPLIANHRITLALQIVDGMVPDPNNNIIRVCAKEICNRDGLTSAYLTKLWILYKDSFFNYHNKYNSQILSELGVTETVFLKRMLDTRHWYSHFLVQSKRKFRLEDGEESIVYFIILCYVLRIYEITTMGLNCIEANIQEYLYCIHDFLIDMSDKPKDLYLSRTYKSNLMFKEIVNRIKRINSQYRESERNP